MEPLSAKAPQFPRMESGRSMSPVIEAAVRFQGCSSFEMHSGISDLDGTVNWFRPSDSRAKLFMNGFATATTLVGSRYEQSFGSPVLTVPEIEDNILVNLDHGDLESGLQQPVTLGPNNRFTITDAGEEKLRIAVSASSGSLQGSFIHPVTGKTTKHRGIIFQKQNLAEGYFLGTAQSGVVLVVPAGDLGRTINSSSPDPVSDDDVSHIVDPGSLPIETPTQPEPRPKRKKRED